LSCSLHLLAVGLENGSIHLFTAPVGGDLAIWTPWVILGSDLAHVLTVSSLDFCPAKGVPAGVVRLASGSEDKSARVFDLPL